MQGVLYPLLASRHTLALTRSHSQVDTYKHAQLNKPLQKHLQKSSLRSCTQQILIVDYFLSIHVVTQVKEILNVEATKEEKTVSTDWTGWIKAKWKLDATMTWWWFGLKQRFWGPQNTQIKQFILCTTVPYSFIKSLQISVTACSGNERQMHVCVSAGFSAYSDTCCAQWMLPKQLAVDLSIAVPCVRLL